MSTTFSPIRTSLRSAEVKNKAGAVTGQMFFLGTKSAAELKAAADAAGLTGAARRRFVKEGLTTPDGARRANAALVLADFEKRGFVPDTARLGRLSASLKFARVPKAGAGRKMSAAQMEMAALRAEIERLKAGAKA
jgi:hypothetical protein